MASNIGIFSTPNGDTSLVVRDNKIIANYPIEFNNKGKIRYEENKRWLVVQNHTTDGDIDKGPFIILTDIDAYDPSSSDKYLNGSIDICSRIDENNKTTLNISYNGGVYIYRVVNGIGNINRVVDVYNYQIHQDNANWYRKYSDGWIEQGGYINGTFTYGLTPVTFPIAFVNMPKYAHAYFDFGNDYLFTSGDAVSGGAATDIASSMKDITNTGFKIQSYASRSWYACGY